MNNPDNYKESHVLNGHGKYYDKTYNSGFYKYQWELLERPLLERIFEKLKNDGISTCLDFACGTGRITEVGEAYFSRCSGVDVSDEMLIEARKKCKETNLINQDITKEKFNGKVSVITAFRYFLNAELPMKIKILNSLNEILENNGCLIVNIHVNSKSILGLVYRIRNILFKRTIANTMSLEEFERILDQTGFAIQNVYWYSYLPRIGWRFAWFYKKFMLPFEKACISSNVVPKNMAQSFLIVAYKK